MNFHVANRLLAVLLIAGAISVLSGIFFTPSVIGQYLSPDGMLEHPTIERIEDLRVYSLIFGNLAVFAALSIGVFLNWPRGKRAIPLLCGGFLASTSFLGSGAGYIFERYANHLLLQPVQIKRVILGQELLLKDYQPRSTLVTAKHEIVKAKYPVINVHEHFTYIGGAIKKRTPEEMVRVMDATGVRMVVDLDGGLGKQLAQTMETYKKKYPARFIIFAQVWFSENPWDAHEHILSGKVADDLEQAVRMGAQGLKIWKNLGLRSKDTTGKVIPVNDPRLDPLWSKAGQLGIPVLIHIADPVANFQPLDRFNEHYEHLSEKPEWNFNGDQFPSHDSVLSQFEHVIKKHPRTIFIGAHMANSADNLAHLASLMDKYPNLYVEFGARVQSLGRQPYTTRKFFIRYQDRILFGTDAYATEEVYRAHFRFLETDDEYFDYPYWPIVNFGRWKIYGLYLPDQVLEKVYYKNAEKILLKRITRVN
jgi:predicted TIM-barrel fold metal-dependent hydrolase